MRDNEAKKAIETAIHAAHLALLAEPSPERVTELRARISRLESALRARRSTQKLLNPTIPLFGGR